jgi:hypothetical protein
MRVLEKCADSGCFSNTTTLAPASCAAIAAQPPAAPNPMMTTSAEKNPAY